MTTPIRALANGSAALIVGLVVWQLDSALRMPAFWDGSFPITYGWDGTLVIGGGLYLALPIVILVVASMRSSAGLSFTASCAVPVAWVCLLFLAWAWKPWNYYREFPWWGVRRHLLPLVAVACSAGVAFWCSGRALRSNPRLQRPAGASRSDPQRSTRATS